MRYLFRGFIKDTGGPVEGHVEAGSDEEGYDALAQNGVITEELIPDPKPLNLTEELPESPEFADALESAFDSSSSQVDFDALSERYHGKKVWVIDRDKIRRRVAQVVDAALALAHQHGEGAGQARERVASAIQGLFNDTRNLATQRNADSIAGVKFDQSGGGGANARFNGGSAPPRPPSFGTGAAQQFAGAPSPALEQQIGRMAQLVKQAESTLAAVAAALAELAKAAVVAAGLVVERSPRLARVRNRNSVLLEIFKSNLELVRGMQDPGGLNAAAAAAVAASPVAESAPIEAPVESSAAPVESASVRA